MVDFQDDLKGVLTTAHPQIDPVSGALYNYLTAFGLTSTYHLYRLDPGSRTRELLTSLEVDRPAYMHSFAMTERHLVLAEFSPGGEPGGAPLLGEGPSSGTTGGSRSGGTRFQLFDRDTPADTWDAAPARPSSPSTDINAFVEEVEGREEVVVDLVGYRGPGHHRHPLLERLRRARES